MSLYVRLKKSDGLQLKKLSLAVASVMLFGHAGAAGLGDLTVQSYLGQPLRAEVELITSPGDADTPIVRLASYEAFRRANIEFNQILLSLQFVTEQRGDKKVVRITSPHPVNEPFVDMLIEFRSNANTVVREYVFLLDPVGLNSVPGAMQDEALATAGNTGSKLAIAEAPRPAAAQAASAEKSPVPTKRTRASAPANGQPTAPATEVKLKLSLTSSLAASTRAEDEISRAAAKEYAAMEKAVANTDAHVKALDQQVRDMQKLFEVTNALLAEMQKQKELAGANTPQAVPTVAASTPPATAEAKPTEAGIEPAPAPVSAPAPAAKPPVAPATTAVAEPEADWQSDMLLLPGAGVLLAVLGALGIHTARRRKQQKPFHDSLFGATTLAAETTRQSNNTLGPHLTSILPTGMSSGEVDAIAEADVYIAYGRDGQAEDLLKEALRAQPENLAVCIKLLAIYAAREDRESFESLACVLRRQTNGSGSQWAQVAEMGISIDPDNPLYASAQATAGTPAVDNASTPRDHAQEEITAAPASPLMENVLESANEAEQTPKPAMSLELTDAEKQLADLLSSPMPDEGSALVEMDVDAAVRSLDQDAFAAIHAAHKAEPEAGIGPIDFDVIVPDLAVAGKTDAVPDIPDEALSKPKESTNLIEFDFLEPAKPAAQETEETVDAEFPEIPLIAMPEPEEETNLISLELLEPMRANAHKKH